MCTTCRACVRRILCHIEGTVERRRGAALPPSGYVGYVSTLSHECVSFVLLCSVLWSGAWCYFDMHIYGVYIVLLSVVLR